MASRNSINLETSNDKLYSRPKWQSFAWMQNNLLLFQIDNEIWRITNVSFDEIELLVFAPITILYHVEWKSRNSSRIIDTLVDNIFFLHHHSIETIENIK